MSRAMRGQAPQAVSASPCAGYPVFRRPLNARSPQQTGHCSRSDFLPCPTLSNHQNLRTQNRKAARRRGRGTRERGCTGTSLHVLEQTADPSLRSNGSTGFAVASSRRRTRRTAIGTPCFARVPIAAPTNAARIERERSGRNTPAQNPVRPRKVTGIAARIPL